jgi:hypothetical protein
MGMPWLTAIAQHSPFAEAFRSIGQKATGASKPRAEFNELPLHQWSTRPRRLVSDQISPILRRSIDPDRSDWHAVIRKLSRRRPNTRPFVTRTEIGWEARSFVAHMCYWYVAS